MPRNLVVFADGTGNSAAKAFKTNVWRLYQALDLTHEDQIAVFDDGVGTSSFKPLQVLGLALGVGVKRNVIDLYKFLCRNYAAGDRIYGFGFSRGAFTIRVLTGLIFREGLVSFRSEEELDRHAVNAYRAYRKKAFATRLPWVAWGRALRDFAIRQWSRVSGSRTYEEIREETRAQGRRKISVHFLGVWDTVAAYGLPIDELTQAVDAWVWPMSFRDRSLLDNVQYARHALSLDEERRTFFPIPWKEDAAKVAAGRLRQVWFAGVHSNVGGGYPDDGLAHVSLCWMIAEAAERGLRFKPWVVASYAALASATGRIYDSRSGFGAFYRYHPRDAGELMGAGVRPLIHSSVVMRMAGGNDGYAPISLPEEVDVLPCYGLPVPFRGLPLDKALAPPSPAPEDPLPVPPSEKRDLAKDNAVLVEALATLGTGVEGRGPLVALVLDTVWWRRVQYVLTLWLAIAVLALPLFATHVHSTVTDRMNDIARGSVASLVGLAGGLVPRVAAPWLEAAVKSPAAATLVALGLIASLRLGSFLQRRIRDRARAAWSVKVRMDGTLLEHARADGQRRAALSEAVLFAVLLVVAWRLDARWELCAVLAAVAIAAALVYVRRTATKGVAAAPPPLLALARALRRSSLAGGTYRLMTAHVLPALALILAAGAILSLANRAAFDAASAIGAFCPDNGNPPPLKDGTAESTATWTTTARCHPTGIGLEEGARYRIRVTMGDDWFDKSVRTDVAGFPATLLRHHVATPWKRWWGENWFQPIARVGRRGNDEYALAPAVPLPVVSYKACEPAASWTSPFTGWRDIPTPISPEDRRAQLACGARAGIAPRTVLVAELTARSRGELFVYVNDAVLMAPGMTDVFYRNNSGTATVAVERIEAEP